MVDDLEDARRQEPPYGLAERPMLEAWLEFHRTTLLLKCEASATWTANAGRRRLRLDANGLGVRI